MTHKLYKRIASTLGAWHNCRLSGNTEGLVKHNEALTDMVYENMPSGSGFDNGTKLDIENSTPNKLIFTTSFHHMNEHGSYDGWTDHTVTVTPDLASGFDLKVSGRDRNMIKNDIADTFHQALNTELES